MAGLCPMCRRTDTIDTIFFTIVDKGKANKILEQARREGASGGTIILGSGTSRSRFFPAMGFLQRSKEILLISASHELQEHLHAMVRTSFKIERKRVGIAFTIPFSAWGREVTEVGAIYHRCIVTIVDKGQSEACIRAARAAGAKGGTVIKGRGAGVPAKFYVDLAIEPQKDIVIILTPAGRSEQIRQRIITDLGLVEPNSGILFVLPVTRVTGLLEERRRRVSR